jgi:hypothetical protein
MYRLRSREVDTDAERHSIRETVIIEKVTEETYLHRRRKTRKYGSKCMMRQRYGHRCKERHSMRKSQM